VDAELGALQGRELPGQRHRYQTPLNLLIYWSPFGNYERVTDSTYVTDSNLGTGDETNSLLKKLLSPASPVPCIPCIPCITCPLHHPVSVPEGTMLTQKFLTISLPVVVQRSLRRRLPGRRVPSTVTNRRSLALCLDRVQDPRCQKT